MDAQNFASREEFWRLQEALNDLSTTQSQHSERIMRLEKKGEDTNKPRGVWGPSSPFPTGLNASHAESTLNPAAEAFRNFDNDPPSGMISSLILDNNEDSRRAASRANSVRFDESANNHYASSRQSIDLPTRTGSGMGSHPLSERSLSHRSDGRGSAIGLGRTNSFGLENSRLLGSIHNSPRVSGHPPPGLFALGPCPAIIRCWLTETFTNDSLSYAAICTGAAFSSISLATLQRLGLDGSIIEENGLRKIRLLVYLAEAKINLPSSRAPSPSPQVPTLTTKFVVDDHSVQDKSIQITLGSDLLRAQNADILFSQDKIMILDDDRNQLSVPIVRPEDDMVYRNLATKARSRRGSYVSDTVHSDALSDQSVPGIIGRPSRLSSIHGPLSPASGSPGGVAQNAVSGMLDSSRPAQPAEILTRTSSEMQQRAGEDSKSATGSEISATTPAKSSSGVWSTSWRSAAGANTPENSTSGKNGSNYSRSSAPRPMKVLRPAKLASNMTRTASNPSTPTDAPEVNKQARLDDSRQESSQQGSAEPKPPSIKSNPVGSASAFGWLNSSQQRKTTTSGGP